MALQSLDIVRRFLPNREVIGVKVHGWGEWFTIIGVAKDSKYRHVTETPEPYFYISIRQIFQPEYGLTFLVRTSGGLGNASTSRLRCSERRSRPICSACSALRGCWWPRSDCMACWRTRWRNARANSACGSRWALSVATSSD